LLAPVPSFAIFELKDIPAALTPELAVLPGGTRLETKLPMIQTPCYYTTFQEMPLYNITLATARYLTMDLSQYGIQAEAGLY